jgi:hypothetical protein
MVKPRKNSKPWHTQPYTGYHPRDGNLDGKIIKNLTDNFINKAQTSSSKRTESTGPK